MPPVDMEATFAHKTCAVCAGQHCRRSFQAAVREAVQHHQHRAMSSSICSRWTP